MSSPVNNKAILKVSFDQVEVKEVEKDGIRYGIIAGYASTYDIDRVGDRVVPGAFKKTIDNFISKNRKIRMFYQHDEDELIGGFDPVLMREDDKGLFVVGEINLGVRRGLEAYNLAKQGVLTDMSIGYSVIDFGMVKGIRELKEIELWEISLVSEPANPSARIVQVKSGIEDVKKACESKREIEKLFKEVGFSRTASKFLISRMKFEEKENENQQLEAVDLHEEREIKKPDEMLVLKEILQIMRQF